MVNGQELTEILGDNEENAPRKDSWEQFLEICVQVKDVKS